MSLIDRGFWDAGQAVTIHLPDTTVRQGTVCHLPFAANTD